ncbi:MAG: FGGY-family carbohydrate kinase [Firmicutes bacterium]|jgi:FGGY-family pentulose kinase|nr:FGGY-family carbohydrate kinase [Bacillota bacterium]MDH7495455.1 FGGY-family carbohydrate kinase [Bacillota bacterium]
MARGLYYLGIDAGTQSLRAGLFDDRGRAAALESEEYPLYQERPGWAEQDPDDWWQAAKKAVRRCLRSAEVSPDQVRGVSVDGTSSTVVFLDASGRPLRRAILWMDSRNPDQAATITATGHPRLRYVGGQESPEWMMAKALWVKENESETWRQAARVMEQTDWLILRLTGEYTASRCNATCKWHYSLPDGGFDESLLAASGLLELRDMWPQRVLPIGALAGELTSQAAEELGLEPGTPVAEGGIDAHIGMIGLDGLEPGRLSVILGTSNVHLTNSEQPVFHRGIWGPYPGAMLEGLWLIEGGQISSGSIVRWFRDVFMTSGACAGAASTSDPYETMNREAAEVPPGCEGLVVLDHWQGNRTPLRDPLSRGVILGLSLKHGRGHLIRAIFEACAFGTRQVLETFREAGVEVHELRACGGATKSRLWLQIYADVCGVPVVLTKVREASVLGSAIVGAFGAGRYSSIEKAAASMVEVHEVVQPDTGVADVYDFYYKRYLQTYEANRDILHSLAARALSKAGG